ncbi:hypothetical protein [Streptomyces sp. WZ-12]|uniref:hypothetical protein n=1 Tax=Streptomyces sp. WZ-12 TaxID=3030210 RepID=UPI00406D2B82
MPPRPTRRAARCRRRRRAGRRGRGGWCRTPRTTSRAARRGGPGRPRAAAPPRTDDATDWAILELGYPVLPAVRQLLQFGDSLEVLDPPEARRVLADTAAALSSRYASPVATDRR